MSKKDVQEIIKLAKKRGWRELRRGAHGPTIMVYPPTGTRYSVWSTPHSLPNMRQIQAQLTNLERSTRMSLSDKFLNWVCEQYNVPNVGSRIVRFRLTDLIQQYIVDGHATQDVAKTLESAAKSSDRLWLADFSTRGATAKPTMRLLLGADHAMTDTERQLVESFPQVNGIIPGQKSGKEVRDDMSKFLQRRGWNMTKSNTWTHANRKIYGKRTPEAFQLAQSMPEVPIFIAKPVLKLTPTEPEFVKATVITPEEVESWPTSGVQVVEDEDVIEPEFRDDYAKPVEVEFPDEAVDALSGLPADLAQGLRDFLKIDNRETLAGLEMVYEAVDAADATVRLAQKALGDVRAALDLVKAAE